MTFVSLFLSSTSKGYLIKAACLIGLSRARRRVGESVFPKHASSSSLRLLI